MFVHQRQHKKVKRPRRRPCSSSGSMGARDGIPRSYTAMPLARPSRAAAAASSSARLAVLPYINESEFAAPFPFPLRPSAPVEPATASALSGRRPVTPLPYGLPRNALVEGATAYGCTIPVDGSRARISAVDTCCWLARRLDGATACPLTSRPVPRGTSPVPGLRAEILR